MEKSPRSRKSTFILGNGEFRWSLEQDHLQKPSLWKNSYQPSLRKNSFLMMSIELECPVLGCKEGPGDAKWKSPLLLYEQAYNELDRHLLYNYPLTRNSINRSFSEYCSPHSIEYRLYKLDSMLLPVLRSGKWMRREKY